MLKYSISKCILKNVDESPLISHFDSFIFAPFSIYIHFIRYIVGLRLACAADMRVNELVMFLNQQHHSARSMNGDAASRHQRNRLWICSIAFCCVSVNSKSVLFHSVTSRRARSLAIDKDYCFLCLIYAMRAVRDHFTALVRPWNKSTAKMKQSKYL